MQQDFVDAELISVTHPETWFDEPILATGFTELDEKPQGDNIRNAKVFGVTYPDGTSDAPTKQKAKLEKPTKLKRKPVVNGEFKAVEYPTRPGTPVVAYFKSGGSTADEDTWQWQTPSLADIEQLFDERVALLWEPFTALQDSIEATQDFISSIETENNWRRSVVCVLGGVFVCVAWVQFATPIMKVARESRNSSINVVQAPDHSMALVVKLAESQVGKEFRPGVSAQCAEFVRFVFLKAGMRLGVTTNPFDRGSTGVPDAPPGVGMADSLAGHDVGKRIAKKEDLQPGDLAFFGGTYDGYPASTITHVGIVVSSGSDPEIVDRNTKGGPVRKVRVSHFEHFYAGLRPYPDNFEEGKDIPYQKDSGVKLDPLKAGGASDRSKAKG